MSMFGKKQSPKPSEPVVAAPMEPKKFKSFDSDDYKAASLSAKYELEISLKDGTKLHVMREAYASPTLWPRCYPDYELNYLPATEFDLYNDLREMLKSIGKDGLFLSANDIASEDTPIYKTGQFIPPANIASMAYRKVEEQP